MLQRAAFHAQRGRGALSAVSLGNELCGQGGIAAHLSPSELAADFRRLREEMSALRRDEDVYSFQGSTLRRRPGLPITVRKGLRLLCFLQQRSERRRLGLPPVLARRGQVMEHLQKKLFDKIQGAAWPLGRGFYAFVNAYTKASRDTPLWITEAGGMYGSGGINVTSSFASAFWYIDELGEAAKKSIQVHCKRALEGGHYGLTQAPWVIRRRCRTSSRRDSGQQSWVPAF